MDEQVVYAACVNYEGCFAVFSTLEKAIAEVSENADVIEVWMVDEPKWWIDHPVVWRRSDG